MSPSSPRCGRSVAEHCESAIEGFVDTSSRNHSVRLQSVSASQHLADLYFLNSRIDQCVNALSRAIDLCEQFVAEHPTSSSYRTLLGNCHQKLAVQLFASGRRSDAIDHFHEARRAYRVAVELSPDTIDPLRRLRWFLAICPEASLRDPGQVLRLTSRMIELERRLARSTAGGPVS